MKLKDLGYHIDVRDRIFYDKKAHDDLVKFLDEFRLDGEELNVERTDSATWYGNTFGIKKTSYTINFNNQKHYTDLGAVFEGRISITVRCGCYEVHLSCPSLNILENYTSYIEGWAYNKINGKPKPIWGTSFYGGTCQHITKQVKTLDTVIKWFNKFIKLSTALIKQGLEWSNSPSVVTQMEYDLKYRTAVLALNKQINELNKKRSVLDNEHETYKKKAIENYKKLRNIAKEFDL